MANKKYHQFDAGTPSDTDIMLYGDPSSGLLKKVAMGSMAPVGIMKRVKVTLDYTDFSDPGSLKTVNAGLTLPAGGIIHTIVVNASTPFDISDYTIGVGSSTESNRFFVNRNVNTTQNDTPYLYSATEYDPNVLSLESMSAPSIITVSAVTGSSTLDAATQGVLDIWIYYSVLD